MVYCKRTVCVCLAKLAIWRYSEISADRLHFVDPCLERRIKLVAGWNQELSEGAGDRIRTATSSGSEIAGSTRCTTLTLASERRLLYGFVSEREGRSRGTCARARCEELNENPGIDNARPSRQRLSYALLLLVLLLYNTRASVLLFVRAAGHKARRARN